jgi:hypothetical protein
MNNWHGELLNLTCLGDASGTFFGGDRSSLFCAQPISWPLQSSRARAIVPCDVRFDHVAFHSCNGMVC